MRILQSLTIPNGNNDTVTYLLPKTYSYTPTIPTTNPTIIPLASFGTEDANYAGIIFLQLNNLIWKIFYCRPLNVLEVLTGPNLSNYQLIITDSNHIALQGQEAFTGDDTINITILNGYNIATPSQNASMTAKHTYYLKAPATVYYGNNIPSAADVNPGSIYIQINPTSTESSAGENLNDTD